jgi:hypothetical protein
MYLFYHNGIEKKMVKTKKRKPIIANRLSGESDMKNFIAQKVSAQKPQEQKYNITKSSEMLAFFLF